MEMPKEIYFRAEECGKELILIADTKPGDVIEDDGPSLVGTYRLVGTKTLEKIIKEK